MLDTEGQLPDANRDAIHAAIAAGIHVCAGHRPQLPVRSAGGGHAARDHHAYRQQRRRRASDGRDRHWRGGLLDRRRRCAAYCDATRDYRDHTALIFDRDDARQIIFETMDWDHPNRQATGSRNHR